MVKLISEQNQSTGVEHINDVDPKVALQPDYVEIGAVEDLYDIRIGEDLVQSPHFRAQSESVDNVIFGSRGDLEINKEHET